MFLVVSSGGGVEGWREGGMAQWRSHNCAATTQDIMVRTAHYRMNGAETFTIFVTTDNSFIVTSF